VAAAREDDYDDDASYEQPWHNRTPAVIGASLLGIVVIGLVVLLGSFVAREFNTPERAPLNFVEPSFSATHSAASTTATTTQTITSTSPPVTTDLSATTPTSTSDTTSTETTSRRDREDGGDDRSSTTRRGPRTNVTRTVVPFRP
jgi:hypothetical protein